jgi:hypothetical protein
VEHGHRQEEGARALAQQEEHQLRQQDHPTPDDHNNDR